METPGIDLLTTLMSLLVVSSVVAILTRNLIRIPYTVALVLAGLLIGFARLIEDFHLSKELILVLFMPPILFEGALNIDLKTLRHQMSGVLLLAIPGTLLSTYLLGVASHYILGLNMALAFLLGAILSPTDPVSVLALFREQTVDRDLAVVVEGESVFNDGLGVVLYLILLQNIVGSRVGLGEAVQIFTWQVLVGAGSGLGLGYLCHRLLGKIDDHLIEVTVSILLSFGCYIVAERFHASGVMAVVVAGIIIGNYGRVFSMSPGTRLALAHFWEVIAFVINSLLFLLIGIDLDFSSIIGQALDIGMVFVAMTIIRFLIVWSIAALLRVSKRAWMKSWKPVIAWGGLKGSIPIALALGLPLSVPHRQDMVSVIFGVVLLSLLLQGLSFKLLLKKLGLGRSSLDEIRLETMLCRLMEISASMRHLGLECGLGTIPRFVCREKIHELKQERDALEIELNGLVSKSPEVRASYLERLDLNIRRTRLAAIGDGLRRGILKEPVAASRRAELQKEEKENSTVTDNLAGEEDGG